MEGETIGIEGITTAGQVQVIMGQLHHNLYMTHSTRALAQTHLNKCQQIVVEISILEAVVETTRTVITNKQTSNMEAISLPIFKDLVLAFREVVTMSTWMMGAERSAEISRVAYSR